MSPQQTNLKRGRPDSPTSAPEGRAHKDSKLTVVEDWSAELAMQTSLFACDPTICSCGDILCWPGPSQPRLAKPAPKPSPEAGSDRVFYELALEMKRFPQHQVIREIFVEHLLSDIPALGYQGGTWKERERVIRSYPFFPVFRSIMLRLLDGTTRPSPDRAFWYEMYNSPTFSAADVAEALYYIKPRFNHCQWNFIEGCFRYWTRYPLVKAWRERLGDEDVYGTSIVVDDSSDRRSRVFRAWQEDQDGYEPFEYLLPPKFDIRNPLQ
ncbi:hypothetical protein TWF696_008058 [Orbilia brochopaga]|uniref:Uncharacterized protein n=1 Tax=Orbilia brochopaga TaxID=3140254 RepID=A0AAV9UT55_9PEZI